MIRLHTFVGAFHDGPAAGRTNVPFPSQATAAFVKSPLVPPEVYASLK